MSSDKPSQHQNEPSTTIIALGTAFCPVPNISSELISAIQEQLDKGKKALLFYSRRGNSRAWICEDCGFFEKCPHCDIAFAYHTVPHKRLICHQCNTIAPFPVTCPKCHGNHIVPVGVGIQQVEENLRSLFPKLSEDAILRIDSDTKLSVKNLLPKIEKAQILLATNIASTLVHPDIGAVGFLLFELNLSLPQFDIEEEIYTEISYYKKQHLPIFIQTYTPDHPLLQQIVFGNNKSFFDTLVKERKQFLYPPFTQFATIRIHDEKKERVRDIIAKLTNKIHQLRKESTFFAFDQDIWEKKRGEWVQKIILKDKNLDYLIQELEVEIVRNRSVTLDWNGL